LRFWADRTTPAKVATPEWSDNKSNISKGGFSITLLIGHLITAESKSVG
jgi:hypothetical protein|tara:strand:- start:572 stop:718 length:147 start_codon:yes stop_codon:yes gene_type:complete